MPTTDEIRATIDQYVERFCVGDSAAWAALFSEDATQEDPVGTPVNVGREAIQAFYDNTSALFGGGLTIALLSEPVILGNEAIVILTATGGAGAARARVPQIVDHMTFADDASIASLRAFWDMASVTPDPES